jgi:hypothetical protein
MSGPISQSLLLEATAEVAQLAARTAMQWYRRGVDVELKGDGSPVTTPIEAELREWIAARFRATDCTARVRTRAGRRAASLMLTLSTARNHSFVACRSGAP